MSAASCPPVDYGDDDFRHGADQSLHFEDMEASAFGFDAGFVDGGGVGGADVVVVGGGVLVSGAAADALVTAGAEGPAPVFW